MTVRSQSGNSLISGLLAQPFRIRLNFKLWSCWLLGQPPQEGRASGQLDQGVFFASERLPPLSPTSSKPYETMVGATKLQITEVPRAGGQGVRHG